MGTLDPIVDSISGKIVQGPFRSIQAFQMAASTTEPLDTVTLTIPHSELSSGKTVSLLSNGSDTGEDFTDDTNSNQYDLSYTPTANIGNEEDLKAEVDGTGKQSNVITITVEEGPDPVTDLSASGGDQQVSLDWTADDTVEGDIQRYEVHRAQSGGFDPSAGDNTKVEDVTSFTEGSSVSYIDDGSGNLSAPSNGATYFYEVIAVDSDGFTADSNEASATLQQNSQVLYFVDTKESPRVQVKIQGTTEVWRQSIVDDDRVEFGAAPDGTNIAMAAGTSIKKIDPDGNEIWDGGFIGGLESLRVFGNHIYVFDGTDVYKYNDDGSQESTLTFLNSSQYDGHSQDDIYTVNANDNVEKFNDAGTSQWTWSEPNGYPIRAVEADPGGGLWAFAYHDAGDETLVYKLDATGSTVGGANTFAAAGSGPGYASHIAQQGGNVYFVINHGAGEQEDSLHSVASDNTVNWSTDTTLSLTSGVTETVAFDTIRGGASDQWYWVYESDTTALRRYDVANGSFDQEIPGYKYAGLFAQNES